MVAVYRVADGLITPTGSWGMPARWNAVDVYSAIDERGFSPVIWRVDMWEVNPGQEFEVAIGFTIRQFSYFPPGIIWQMFLAYSWAPSWPPSPGYYVPLYDGIPSCGGIVKAVRVRAPEAPSAYYIYIGMNQHYGLQQVIRGVTERPPLLAHAKIVRRRGISWAYVRMKQAGA